MEALEKAIERLQGKRAFWPSDIGIREQFYLTRTLLTRLFGADSVHLAEVGVIEQIHADENKDAVQGFFYGARTSERLEAVLRTALHEVTAFWENNVKETAGAITSTSHDNPLDPSVVFVIHGRQKRDDMHAFLRAIGLKPLEWSQARKHTGSPNPYTWQVVDLALTKAGAIVALMTPDDEARLREDLWHQGESAIEKAYLHQPRQNVLFEAGVAYGRRPDRTVLVRVGSHRPMSDLAGHHMINISNSPDSRQALADALASAGCPVDLSGSDWFKAGDFDF